MYGLCWGRFRASGFSGQGSLNTCFGVGLCFISASTNRRRSGGWRKFCTLKHFICHS